MSKILFVDDDLSLLTIFEEYFSDEFSIYITDNENKALKILENEEIAIAVVDLHLGNKSGFNLLNLIKIKYPATNRIMLTGDLQISNVKKAINEVNVAKYYNKPIEFDTLREDFKELVNLFNTNKTENSLKIKNNEDNIQLKNFIYTRNSMLLEILSKYKSSNTITIMRDLRSILLEKLRELKINLHLLKDNRESNLLLIENQLEELLIFADELECYILYYYLLVIKIAITLFAGQEEKAIQIFRGIQHNQKLINLIDETPLLLRNLAEDFIETHISSRAEISFNTNLIKLLRINYVKLLEYYPIIKRDFEAKFNYILIIKDQKTLYQRTINAIEKTDPAIIGNFIIAINEFISEILTSEGSVQTIDHDAGTILVHKVSQDLYYVGIAVADNIKTRVVLKEFANVTHKYFSLDKSGIAQLDLQTSILLDNELDKILNK